MLFISAGSFAYIIIRSNTMHHTSKNKYKLTNVSTIFKIKKYAVALNQLSRTKNIINVFDIEI